VNTRNDRRAGPGVLVDLDGTLVDSNYLHTLAWARAFVDVGEWAPMNAIHRLIGAGGDQLIARLLGHENRKAEQRRSVRYLELINEVRPFPGARQVLVDLRDAGLAVVLATSSPGKEVDKLVELLGVRDVLTAVTTADDVANAKPAPDVLLAAMEAGSVDPRRAVLIGDSIWDVRASIAAGIGVVAVETGGFSRHELMEEGAREVYRDIEQLRLQLQTSVIGHLLEPSRDDV
jgi:HAD superfamily hydrolase (TIGR01509 family)